MGADTAKRRQVVDRYFEGFRRGDHDAVLDCLADDVVWDIVGVKRLVGKADFDAEIENEQFEGQPELAVERLVADGEHLVALGEGRGRLRDGGGFSFAFCTAFEFAGEAIARVRSYIVALTPRPG
ncbi:MAG: nuclear transport factor 2 family protein [Solirubrobacterales bacterium]